MRYMHSDVETLERIEIIRDLRLGAFDVLVGINLLREGLDIPECALVAILDADKEGYLRSHTSLIQTIGRAARNIDGRVILYADKMTDSCKPRSTRPTAGARSSRPTTPPTASRRKSIKQGIGDILQSVYERDHVTVDTGDADEAAHCSATISRLSSPISRSGCGAAAADLEFEEAARLRDEIRRLEVDDLGISSGTAHQQKLDRARSLLEEPSASYRAAQQRKKAMRERGSGGRSRGGRTPIRG